MGIGKFKRKLRNSKKGVSEIIANILILGITVTLFSSIMIFVAEMPTPQKNAYADFTPSIRYLPSSNEIELNMTHKGGQELICNDTGFYIFVNDTKNILSSKDIIDSVGKYRWAIGGVFSYKIYIDPNIYPDIYKVRLSVMITDKEKNTMVYSANVVGGTASVNTPPIIGARGTTPSPTYENTSFSFYVQITDLDNDLDSSSVNIDLTSIGGPASVQMSDTNKDGIFTAGPYLANIEWNGKIVFVTCSDLTGNTSSGQIPITIFRTFSDNNGGGGGYPSDFPINIDMSGLQGFNIFEWKDWEANNFNATPEREFTHGESAVVVVVSKYLVNLNQENVLLVMDQTTKVVVPSVSSPSNTFAKYKINVISGYYIYNISINTGLIPDHAYYQLQMQLRDSWVPNNIFFANDMIKVGTPSPYPSITTYKDSAFNKKSLDFNTTDTIYVEIINKFGGAWNQYGGDVEIRDFFWNAQVKRTPPTGGPGVTAWNGPVSNVWNLASTNIYRFEISLQNATDGATWIPGKNAYNLRFDMFKAGSETYLLTEVINITAPKWKVYIVAGGLLQSGGRYSSPASMFYYKNDNQWSPPGLLETSSDKAAYDPDVVLVRTGDMDQDGKSDIVAIRNIKVGAPNGAGYYLAWYKNTGTGWTKYEIKKLVDAPLTPAFTMAIGNIDLDNDLDIVVGIDNQVWLYRNDGNWSKSMISNDPSILTVIQVADMDPKGTLGNDANRSLDVAVGRENGIVTIYKNALGTGTIWTPSSVTKTTADIFDDAYADIPISGTVVGTYVKTTNPYQDDGTYQQITEVFTNTIAGIYPTLKGTRDNVTDLIADLRYGNPDNPYTVLSGETAEIAKWDSTNLYDTYPDYVVTFNAKVKTIGYSGGDYIKWWNGGTANDLIAIGDTSGNYQELSENITDVVKTLMGNKPTNLQNLTVSFTNTKGGNVDFDYWTINITYYKTGDKLEHIWTIDVRPGTAHTFEVYSYRSTTIDGDALRFAYSTDNISYTNMITVTATTLPMNMYTYSSISLQGTVYIKVYDTVRNTSSPSLDWIKVGKMTVKTTATVSIIGSKVLALDVSDINKDGSNDLLVVTYDDTTKKGQIYVGLNNMGDVFTTLNLVASDANYKSAISAEAGKFFDSTSKARLDIMISTSNTVYMLRYNSGSYGVYKTFSGTGILRAMAADVDNNGFTDVIVVTSSLDKLGKNSGGNNSITLYINGAGTTLWKSQLVDNISGLTIIRDCDVGRLQTS